MSGTSVRSERTAEMDKRDLTPEERDAYREKCAEELMKIHSDDTRVRITRESQWMTKPEARQLLHAYAHKVHAQGWEMMDFLLNFQEVWGLAPQDVTDAAEIVPEALEHTAQVVWFPTRRDR